MTYDVVILGAGAAGMMAAIEAGRRGRRVLVIDHAKAVGEKFAFPAAGAAISQIWISVRSASCRKTRALRFLH